MALSSLVTNRHVGGSSEPQTLSFLCVSYEVLMLPVAGCTGGGAGY